MNDYYNGVNSRELMRFFGLSSEDQKKVKSEMMKDMYIDLHKQGFRPEVIRDKLVKSFNLKNYSQLYRFFKISDLNLE